MYYYCYYFCCTTNMIAVLKVIHIPTLLFRSKHIVQMLFCNEILCRFPCLWIRDASTQSDLTGISSDEPGLKTNLSMSLKLNSVDNLSVNRHYVMSTKTSQPMNGMGRLILLRKVQFCI